MQWEIEYISSPGGGSMSDYVTVTLVPIRPCDDVISIKVQCLRGMFQHGRIYDFDVSPKGFKKEVELPHGKEFEQSKRDWVEPTGLQIMPRALTPEEVNWNPPTPQPKIGVLTTAQCSPRVDGRSTRQQVGERVKTIHKFLLDYPMGMRTNKIGKALAMAYEQVYNSLLNHQGKLFDRHHLNWIAIPQNDNTNQGISENRASG